MRSVSLHAEPIRAYQQGGCLFAVLNAIGLIDDRAAARRTAQLPSIAALPGMQRNLRFLSKSYNLKLRSLLRLVFLAVAGQRDDRLGSLTRNAGEIKHAAEPRDHIAGQKQPEP